jgi:hypothetical protein
VLVSTCTSIQVIYIGLAPTSPLVSLSALAYNQVTAMNLNHGSTTMSTPPFIPNLPPFLSAVNIHGIAAPYHPVPEAILFETPTHYIVSFEPDVAGINTSIGTPNQRMGTPKAALAAAYPELVEAWETKNREKKYEAMKIKRNITGYAYYFQSEEKELRDKDPGVACDQSLLPGMRKHWGELRRCETHWRERLDFQVCKGCRVAHHTMPDREYDRSIVMTRGARVPICEDCAAKVVEEFGVGHRGCICDSKWTCARCREEELKKLGKARRYKHIEGRCGLCRGNGALAEDVEVCLHCSGTRTYERST